MSVLPVDADARRRALDPARSFIVQAPAGSGKTELLTRRVLTLLATVERPEDVLAITFTRKAAAEMRHRVVAALQRARDHEPAADSYEAEGIALATRVLERDAELGWNVVEDPERLAIRTIDSLATQLATRLPVLSSLGAPMGTIDNAAALYLEAAERFVERRLTQLRSVSRQLDHQLPDLCKRLADLLAVRDQWSRYLGDDFDDTRVRQALESMLADLVKSRLEDLRAAAPPGLCGQLQAILSDVTAWLVQLGDAGEIELSATHRELIELADELTARDGRLPSSDVDDLSLWQFLAQVLLTASGSVRKTVTIRDGFPAKGASKHVDATGPEIDARKADMKELLSGLDADTAFADGLQRVRGLPEPAYTDKEWALLRELAAELPMLLSELHVVFAERGTLDFTEIAMRALLALGTDEDPTDLALGMDLSIKHLLVDEFQDTSRPQFELFERLLGGWEAGDGRTFFAVGDPMQSIYRFREGDVGLFLKACESGIGPVALEPLRLSVNFRSSPEVIDWVNTHVGQAFPTTNQADIGAVVYEPSSAFRHDDGAVCMHVLAARQAPKDSAADKQAEGEHVAGLVQQALNEGSESVGILVRARSHVPAVIDALQALNIPFRAVELETLGDRVVVQDIAALALALRYPHDRISWLSVLRGPLCGLTLNDLHALCHEDKAPALSDLMQDASRVSRLSDDGQQRLKRFAEEAVPALRRGPRSTLMPWVEALWLRLGGPGLCRDRVDRTAAEQAIVRLSELERENGLWQRATVKDALERLYAEGDTRPDAERVQIMTLHKSKGLEFDTVILPRVAQQGQSDKPRLLDWYECGHKDGGRRLLLAPIDAPHTPDNRRSRIGRLLHQYRRDASAAEQLRLLYVACTRARRQLHLVATLSEQDGEWRDATRGSLIGPCWSSLRATTAPPPSADEDVIGGADDVTPEPAAAKPYGPVVAVQSLERIVTDWSLPDLQVFDWQRPPPAKIDVEPVVYDWQGSTARDVGTVVHRELQRLADMPEASRKPPGADDLDRISRQLLTLGVTEADLDTAAGRVARGIANTLDDERGRWTLQPHTEARSEWPLSVPTVVDGVITRVERFIIDRSFLDENGVRWIVDYKTGSHEGGGLDTFLDTEVERYRYQLEGYARVAQQREPDRRVKVGLWFPMVRGWREVRVSAVKAD